MKSITLVIFSSLLLMNMTQAQVSEQFSFSVNDVETEQVENFDVVRLKGTVPLSGEGHVGDPQLPVFYARLLLPEGATVTGVNISPGASTQITGSYNVFPVQPPVSLDTYGPLPFINPNAEIYDCNFPFPESPLVEYTNHRYREYSYVNVGFIPFDYTPSTGDLSLHTNVTVTVNYTISGYADHKLRPENAIDERARELVGQSVVNENQIDQFYPDEPVQMIVNPPSSPTVYGAEYETTDLPSLLGGEVVYVIITNNTNVSGEWIGNMTGSFQEFADWKTQQGTPAKIVTVDDIRANYPGNDIPEKIRNFIQDAHLKWGTEYVLLGGNAEIVPVRWTRGDRMPTDLYYSAIIDGQDYGDWDTDGDGLYGEYGSVDFTPDIGVGRAPVDTEAEVERFKKKNFTYGRFDDFSPLVQSLPNGLWLEKQLAVHGVAFSVEWDQYSNGLKMGYNIIKAHDTDVDIYGMFEYFEDWEDPVPDFDDEYGYAYYPLDVGDLTHSGVNIADEFSTLSGVMAQIDQGYGMINILDHMGPYRIGFGRETNLPNITADDFQALTDDGKYGVMIAIGCHTAPVERDMYIGEQWLNSPGGGVAFIGTAADSYVSDVYPFLMGPHPYETGYLSTIYDDHIYKLGNFVRQTSMNTSQERNLYEILQIIGDPDLTLYTTDPIGSLAFTHDTSIPTGNQNFVVNGPSIFPLLDGGIKVSIYKEGEVLAQTTAEPGDFPLTFNITPDTPGELEVTATAHNLEPYEGVVQVVPNSNVHLYKTDNLAIDDENNNGIIEPGESVDISFELHNTGQVTASNISAMLSTTDPNTQITQNTSAYTNIAADGTKVSQVQYTFKASAEAPIQAIPFNLDISSSQGTFSEPFLLNLKNTDLELGDRSALVDNVDVNIFNAGDQVDVFIDVENNGTIKAEGLDAVLSIASLPPNVVSVTDGTSTYGDIQNGDVATNPSAFTLDIGANYSGQQLLVDLELTDDFGAVKTFQIDLTEAYPPEITGFGYSSTGREITTSWDPVQNIREYNIYRSDTQNGTYTKLNDELTTVSSYHDTGLEPMTEYWYKIGVVALSGSELELDQLTAYMTKTKIGYHGDFPIKPYPGYGTPLSSPIAYDVDGNGTKEIFTDHYAWTYFMGSQRGRIMGFYESGQELFDIDSNPETVSGFARTETGISSNPAIGDLDNDGHAEVVVVERGHEAPSPALHAYKTTDGNNDNKPDPLWGDGILLDPAHPSSTAARTMRNPVLSDLDDDGDMEILVLQERQLIQIYNHTGAKTDEIQIGSETYSEGELAVANVDGDMVDGDMYKEIFVGVEDHDGSGRGAIYRLDYKKNQNDDFYLDSNLIKEFDVGERADNGPVLADIDNNGKYEVLIITRNGSQGRVYALNVENGNPVNSNWNGSMTISTNLHGAHNIPRIAVGDINGDGNLEIVFGSSDKLHVLKNNGGALPGFPKMIGGSEGIYVALADIDGDPGIEIIANSMGYNSESDGTLYAFNNDGSECEGWELQPKEYGEFGWTPYVGDIDADGMNEVVVNNIFNKMYVYDTTGDADKVEWGSYRGNAQNTGAYETAECMISNSNDLDLMIRDNLADTGAEPNNTTQKFWKSPDIWVRNQPDGLFVRQNENPEYSATNPPYIYIKITNKSCVTSSGDDLLKLYWAKANLHAQWPDAWVGNVFISGIPIGGNIGSISIPSMEPGQEVVLEVPWDNMPNPDEYDEIDMNAPWHFCILARIETPNDPMASLGGNTVKRNNNIASKNVHIDDDLANRPNSGTVLVGNFLETPKHYTLEFAVPEEEPGKPVYEDAEVSLEMNDVLYEAWTRGGRQSTNLRETRWENKKIVTGNHARLENLIFAPREMGLLNVGFNFLTEEVSKTEYAFDAIQMETDGDKILGGETYLIRRDPRNLFMAGAGSDKTVNENQMVTIQADTINEPATYNWYDPNGNLIHTGKTLSVSPEITKKYKLEIIADTDGYKDYDEVEIKVNGPSINGITPNPTSGQVVISYDVQNNSSAYLMVTNSATAVSNNYILDVQQSQINIDASSYPIGVYVVTLICDGEMVDSENLLKQ